MYHVFTYYFPNKYIREYKHCGYYNTFESAFNVAFENIKFYKHPGYTKDFCLKQIQESSYVDLDLNEYVQVHVRKIKTND
jgi:hypothetical protein